MTLSYQRLTKGIPEYESTKDLYNLEFPDKTVEPEFDYFIESLQKMSADVFAYRNDGEYAGYSITIPGEKLVYYYMIAVSPAMRSKGVGGQMASLLKNTMYPDKPFCALVEADDLSPEGIRAMERRLAFHARIGLKKTGYHLRIKAREYMLLSTSETFQTSDCKDIVDKFFETCKEMTEDTALIRVDE